jgi:hypothetical protein
MMMHIMNKTNMDFVQKQVKDSRYWVAQAVFDLDNTWKLNPELTFGIPLKEKLTIQPETTQIRVHELDQGGVEVLVFIHRKIIYRALNLQSFWQFFNNILRIKKQPTQTVAKFVLPPIRWGEEFRWGIFQGAQTAIKLPPLPWTLTQLEECRPTEITPTVARIDYHIFKKRMKFTLSYRVTTETLLTIQNGETHATV